MKLLHRSIRGACGRFFVAILLLCLFGTAKAFSANHNRPNFIFVLIDDMGYGDLSCYGADLPKTGNIDSLASEGIRFTQFYVGAPICSPSRTAFLTGQNPARWKINSFLASREENARRGIANWLDPKAPSVARALHSAGYKTGHFGKWHMGGQRDVAEAPLITEYGFDESLTQFEGLGDRILPLLDAFDDQPPKKYALGSDNLGRGKIEWMDRSKVTGAFVNRTIDFIKNAEKTGTPFYVNVWPDDVHSPFFPPKALRTDTAKRELYHSVVKAMDDQLGALFNYVRTSPTLRTNTVIVVASDNGPEPGAGTAGPFRGHKGNLFEGGIREPLIVWGPGLMPKSARGTVNETTVVSDLDLLPSILGIAGVVLPRNTKFEGENHSDALLGNALVKREKPLFWNRPPDRPGDDKELWPDLAVRDGNWKLLVMNDGSNPQLYDLSIDPGETRNIAAQNPEVVRNLSRSVLAWWQTMPKNPVSVANKE